MSSRVTSDLLTSCAGDKKLSTLNSWLFLTAQQFFLGPEHLENFENATLLSVYNVT